MEETAQHFQIREVSADKAYTGRKNLALVGDLGATPYVPFKDDVAAPPSEDSMWSRMYHYYMFERKTLLEHYRKRSNVETVFSMIKGKFGDAVRGKSDVAQINEVLCKVLCHNVCVLVQSMHDLGIEPVFASTPLLA